jgi:hypothetical protein
MKFHREISTFKMQKSSFKHANPKLTLRNNLI